MLSCSCTASAPVSAITGAWAQINVAGDHHLLSTACFRGFWKGKSPPPQKSHLCHRCPVNLSQLWGNIIQVVETLPKEYEMNKILAKTLDGVTEAGADPGGVLCRKACEPAPVRSLEPSGGQWVALSVQWLEKWDKVGGRKIEARLDQRSVNESVPVSVLNYRELLVSVWE